MVGLDLVVLEVFTNLYDSGEHNLIKIRAHIHMPFTPIISISTSLLFSAALFCLVKNTRIIIKLQDIS